MRLEKTLVFLRGYLHLVISVQPLMFCHAWEGDTVTAKYVDDTLPLDSVFENMEITATVLLGLTGPPMDRVPTTNARILDSSGNLWIWLSLKNKSKSFQILLTIKIGNKSLYGSLKLQTVTKRPSHLGWIDGILSPDTSFSPSLSWSPLKEGKYTATMFTWESIDNPSALAPPIKIEFAVVAEKPEPKKPKKENYNHNWRSCKQERDCYQSSLRRLRQTQKSLDAITDWHFLPLNHGEWGTLR